MTVTAATGHGIRTTAPVRAARRQVEGRADGHDFRIGAIAGSRRGTRHVDVCEDAVDDVEELWIVDRELSACVDVVVNAVTALGPFGVQIVVRLDALRPVLLVVVVRVRIREQILLHDLLLVQSPQHRVQVLAVRHGGEPRRGQLAAGPLERVRGLVEADILERIHVLA